MTPFFKRNILSIINGKKIVEKRKFRINTNKGKRVSPLKLDPSRTGRERRAYLKELRKRYAKVKADMLDVLVKQDYFNLKEKETGIEQIAGNADGFQFYDASKARRISSFRRWLNKKIDDEILSYEDGNWSNKYLESAYMKGVVRSYVETHDLTKEEARMLEQGFGGGVRKDTVQLLYSKNYDYLKSTTETGKSRLGAILAKDFAEGKSLSKVTRDLVNQLGMSRRNAERVAVTEIAYAQAEGQLDGFKDLEVPGLTLDVEFQTAHDSAVCEECAAMEGDIYTVEEARGIIPVHPRCRCAWVPTFEGYNDLVKQAKQELRDEGKM